MFATVMTKRSHVSYFTSLLYQRLAFLSRYPTIRQRIVSLSLGISFILFIFSQASGWFSLLRTRFPLKATPHMQYLANIEPQFSQTPKVQMGCSPEHEHLGAGYSRSLSVFLHTSKETSRRGLVFVEQLLKGRVRIPVAVAFKKGLSCSFLS